jgi:uncharacterized protein (TIGR02569 family)
VLTSFGLDRQIPVRPVGGAVVAGDLVFKTVEDEAEAAWVAETMSSLVVDEIRIPRPARTDDGRWVAEGWAAWQHLSGRPALRWSDILSAGRAFHAATRSIERPDVLDLRTHPWARADRMAWGEEAVPHSGLAGELLGRVRPLDIESQVVHGDLTGNVLFAEGEPPAVIDFSPYWRPAGHAVAQIVVDALLWYGADVSLVAAAADIPEIEQLLARALMFRLVLDGLQLRSAAPTALFTQAQVTSDLERARPLVRFLQEETARRRPGGRAQNGYSGGVIG